MSVKSEASLFESFAREALFEASQQPLGVLLRCSDPVAVRTKLYPIRAAMFDPEMDRLQFRVVDLDGGNLAITKGKAKPTEPAA